MTHIQPQFQMVDPRLIQPNPWNTNVVSHENEEKLKASIERHGMFKPVLVRTLPTGALESIGGWHRAEQAVELGMPEIPVINLGQISDEKAKEISLADNARYGIDDSLKLSELLGELDTAALEATLPWTQQDISVLTASLSVDIDNLDLDQPDISDDDGPEEAPAPKVAKTHQTLRFRNSIADAQRVSALITRTMQEQGFTGEDDLTNAGDALAYLLLRRDEDDDVESGADDVEEIVNAALS